MTTDPRLQDVFTRLVRVQTRLWNDVDARVRSEHGVPLTDLTTLQVVAETPGCRVQEIVTTLHITVGGASKVVDRLVASGLVVRAGNPDDRRSSIVTTTQTGLALLKRTGPDVEDVLAKRLAPPLTPADLDVLDQILRTLQVSSPGTPRQKMD